MRKPPCSTFAVLFSGLVLLGATLPASPAHSVEALRQPSAAPEGTAIRFTPIAEEDSGIRFENAYDDPKMWDALFREFTLGSVATGLAVADFDGDGWPDIFAVSKTGPNRLYRFAGHEGIAPGERPPLHFQDVTERAGVAGGDSWAQGAAAADVNSDGWPDLYVSRFRAPNELYINQGDGTFSEEAEAWGVAVVDASVHAVFSDYDRDGDLDFYLQTNILDYSQSPKGQFDYLFRNEAGERFTEVTTDAGIYGLGQGHSATWWDFNRDGWPDLYVANDFENSDRLYRNNGDGTFSDVLDEVIPYTSFFSMGSDAADIDNDGHADLLVADMAATTHYKDKTGMAELSRGIWETERLGGLAPQYMRNTLYRNTGNGRFQEIAYLAGIEESDWTWSVRWSDLDNDGWLDLHITNGMVRDFVNADLLDRQRRARNVAARARIFLEADPLYEHNLAFRNQLASGSWGFDNVGPSWGLDQFGIAFGCVHADFDRDGDLDIAFTTYDQGLALLRNDSPGGQRLLVRLEQGDPATPAIGARVELDLGDRILHRTLQPYRGVVSTDEPLLHFGLGDHNGPVSLTVHWPAGTSQVVEAVPVNQLVTIRQPPAAAADPMTADAVPPEPLFEESGRSLGLNVRHRENEFDEFAREFLLPERKSMMGPGVAVGDVNGDGREDLFVGGSAGQSGVLLLAPTEPGDRFHAVRDGPWAAHEEREDTAPLFLDIDSDGDLDLFVASGGGEFSVGSPALQDRLYRNQGGGLFVDATAEVLPVLTNSTGAATAADYDRDGDLDLFLGSRLVPGAYGQVPASTLLTNRDGILVDTTAEVVPGLDSCGMVTAATWADLDGDGWIDLAVASDWGPVRWWRNRGDRTLAEDTVRSDLDVVHGLWRSLAAVDLNEDGRMDLVAGNLGLNTEHRASRERPLTLYWGDLDGDGSREHLETTWEEGRLFPLRSRSKLAYQIPSLTRRFRSFDDFARADITALFGAEALGTAAVLEADELRSGAFINDGGGRFTFAPFPAGAQVAPVDGIGTADFTGDGRIDLVLVQNSEAPDPESGAYAGGLGVLLEGDGNGHLRELDPADSGIHIPRDGQAAAVVDLNHDGRPDLFVTRNDDRALAFLRQATGTMHRSAYGEVQLRGNPGNPQAVGAVVSAAFSDARTVTWQVSAGQGYLSQSSATIAIGDIAMNPPVSLSVRWPDGTVTTHVWPLENGQPARHIDLAQP